MPKTMRIKGFARMPLNADKVFNGMHVVHFPSATAFKDRDGNIVETIDEHEEAEAKETEKDKVKPHAPIGYYEAAWDIRSGHVIASAKGDAIYVRDRPLDGSFSKPSSWHRIASFGIEYGVPKQKRLNSWELLLANQTRDLPRIRRGFRLGDNVFWAEEHDGDYEAKNGPADPNDVWLLEADPTWAKDPMQRRYALTEAQRYILDVTNDEHSYHNLLRMFATPFLEPYKHLTFVLYGEGGNGKGILLGGLTHEWPGKAVNIDTGRIARSGGFTGEQESAKLIGALWAFDEEADVVDERSMNAVKRISTGDSFNAREIGENAVTIYPESTMVISTNKPVISDITAASERRFALVRMKDGRKASDFDGLRAFIREYGMTPFLYASWLEWRRGDQQYTDVSIGDASDMNEGEQWARDMICTDGYAICSANPFHRSITKDGLNKMGLQRKTKRIERQPTACIVVKDERRFKVYRDAFMKEVGENPTHKRPEDVIKVESTKQLDPNTYGFHCRFTECDPNKQAIDWKKKTENGGLEPDKALNDNPVYATVPDEGSIVLDLDTSNDGDGWDLLCDAVGEYGTPGFPKTYLVRTPHGGYHAYYRLPDRLRGKVKNAAHPKWDGWEHGLPIDTRLERKGYVVGAMSVVNNHSYDVVDLPDGEVPELSEPIENWMAEHGYMEDVKPKPRQVPKFKPATEAKPDLSSVPEGQRNTILHDWAYGRLFNHPDNERGIHDDLIVRGHNSGLRDDEIETIWNSILRQLH